jgi:hypothetical protein
MSDQCCQFTLTDEDEVADCCGGQGQCSDHDTVAASIPATQPDENVA